MRCRHTPHPALPRAKLAFVYALLLSSCSVYDADLLVDRGISSRDAAVYGSGDTTDTSPLGIMYQEQDGGAGVAWAICGDGRIEAGESCDTALGPEQSGACPARCPPLPDCRPRVLNGSGCQAACVYADGELGCRGGDGCCPTSCTHTNDADCSARCGDGIVQTESGETCEFQSAIPCKTTVSECDDGDPCTVDSLTGSLEHCDVACVHLAITSTAPGDGCCPNDKDANALTDNDCSARCGNGVVEPGEVCDGEDDCDPSCKNEGTPEQLACLSASDSECEKCACMHCTATELACRVNGSARSQALCSSVVDCGQKNSCPNATACYCGPLLCLLQPIDGPCKTVVDNASGNTTFEAAMMQAGDAGTPLGRAWSADNCRIDQCKGVCR